MIPHLGDIPQTGTFLSFASFAVRILPQRTQRRRKGRKEQLHPFTVYHNEPHIINDPAKAAERLTFAGR
jgi:hypothetical protein